MANFYIVMDESTAWGVGKTKEQALQEATRRVTRQVDTLGVSLEEAGIRYKAELHRGGYYLEPITIMEWDEQLVDVDGGALARLAWEQQRYNNFAPLNPVMDTQYLTTVEDVTYCINTPRVIDSPTELLAASYALNAAKEAGRGFSKEEIEYHLDALVAAYARFNYVIARGQAMAIASRFYAE